MSPQDVFASQMWPWPDPAIKRDSMGRVLFMNAAFLQLYGGRIEDWQGNVVSGWPAPQPPGIPYRFETRIPADGQENVYDWIEYTLADGSAMALARNVTHLSSPPDPKPGDISPVQQQPAEQAQAYTAPPLAVAAVTASIAGVAAQAHSALGDTPSADQPPVESFVSELDVPEITVPDIEVPDLNLDPVYTDKIEQSAPAIAPSPAAVEAAPQIEVMPEPSELVNDTQENASETEYSQVPEVPEVPIVQAPIQEAPTEQPHIQEPPAAEATSDRAYERRALPIEDDSAVLGNNWRDAVIAKAVGAEVESAEAEEEAPMQAAETTGPNEGPIRILLAEDNAINALLTRTLLEAEGHIVDTVEDGALAVEAMKTSSYDLILMDMRMPNMDGLESTRKIRALSNVPKGLPIIALTANAFDDDRNACFDSGMNDFMTKPVSAEELSEMVKTWTKNSGARVAA